ncbi:MAG: AbrB/MazE/SpoVT family DNA-binding domain-containing protein [Candidatus Bathyarchaeia archaeon]
MGDKVKVLQKGKITIPAKIRQILGIEEGDYVELEISANKLIVLPPQTQLLTLRSYFRPWAKEFSSLNPSRRN